MAEVPYTTVPSKIPKLLDKLATGGVPDKVTQKYLEAIGFKSTNDRSLIAIVKHIGLIDGQGVPTQLWQTFRSATRRKSAVAMGVREGYAGLFRVYPDAYRKDAEAIKDYFSSKTTVAERTLQFMVQTFRELADYGDFESQAPEMEDEKALEAGQTGPATRRTSSVEGVSAPQIHLNVQLHLPDNAPPETLEAFFRAMKKYLLDGSA
jgi:hypothetical protein